MLDRCRNPSAINYKWYGAKGIDVCKEWESFKEFVKDMDPRPKGYVLHRIDKSVGYCPQNCQWSPKTGTGQGLHFLGTTASFAEWSRRTGLKSATIRSRILRGWPVEKALGHPAKEIEEFRYCLRLSTKGEVRFSKETENMETSIQQLIKLRKQKSDYGLTCDVVLMKRRYDSDSEDDWHLVC